MSWIHQSVRSIKNSFSWLFTTITPARRRRGVLPQNKVDTSNNKTNTGKNKSPILRSHGPTIQPCWVVDKAGDDDSTELKSYTINNKKVMRSKYELDHTCYR